MQAPVMTPSTSWTWFMRGSRGEIRLERILLVAALYRPCLVRQKPQGGDRALEKVQGLRTLW